MSTTVVEIESCPEALLQEALALVLRDLAPEQRREMAAQVVVSSGGTTSTWSTLMVARQDNELLGAAWGQLQPGKTAVYWAPQVSAAADGIVAAQLTQAVAEALDAANVDLTQTLLADRTAPIARVLESAGFHYLAELLYMAGDATATPAVPASREPLEYVAYDDSLRSRLVDLVERTYAESQDCAAMTGKRRMDDVLDGYRATGVYRPENWLIVRCEGRDVGVLLLASEPAVGHCELVYMGLVPEARGQGRGVQIARHALQIAERAGAERVVLAVDAANGPALSMYGEAGFTIWDRRTVYVRYRGG